MQKLSLQVSVVVGQKVLQPEDLMMFEGIGKSDGERLFEERKQPGMFLRKSVPPLSQ
jgi:hypothetical protein